MTLPKEPLSRQEQYLNKIATGEGETPVQPLSRVEQYLSYICENGGISNGEGGNNDKNIIDDLGVLKKYPTIVHPQSMVGKKYILGESTASLKTFIYYYDDTTTIKKYQNVIIFSRPEFYYSIEMAYSYPSYNIRYVSQETGEGTWSVQSSKINSGRLFTNDPELYDFLINSSNFSLLNPLLEQDNTVCIQQTRGDSDSISGYKGKQGQIVVNTTDNSIHIMDGVTAGGHKISPTVAISQASVTDLEERILKLENAISSMQV